MHVGEDGNQVVELEGYHKKFVSQDASWGRLATYYKPVWVTFLMFVFALINSFQVAAFALGLGAYWLLFMEYMSKDFKEANMATFSSRDDTKLGGIDNFYKNGEVLTKDDLRHYTFIITVCWCSFNIFSGIINGLHKSTFQIMGERLTYNLRLELLTAILYKQVSWFDREDRAPGILTNIMSENMTELHGMTSETVVSVVEVVFSLVEGILIGFIVCWQQATISLILCPIAIGGGLMSSRIYHGKKGNVAAKEMAA